MTHPRIPDEWQGTPIVQAGILNSDIETIESLSDAAIRAGHTQTAIQGYALALRLRGETEIHPKRRADDVT